MQRVEEGKTYASLTICRMGGLKLLEKDVLGREKPTNQANTVEVVGLWRGKSIIE